LDLLVYSLYAFAAVVTANVVEVLFFMGQVDSRRLLVSNARKILLSIYNYNGSAVVYSKANTSPSPAVTIKLPDFGNIVTDQPQKVTDRLKVEEILVDSMASRTKNKKVF
jgi:hypothetical protein